MTNWEEKFVRSRHWFWAAVILLLSGILYMGLAPAAETTTLPMEWRAFAFLYEDRTYKRVTDLFDVSFPDQLTCLKAAAQGLNASAPKFKDGDAMIVGCFQVPVLKPSVTT